ncbi:atp-binding cassette sub-family b [Holotrichia oblita]|nr:atp-binding cassette sub-family b [Holotrichia oblita]
MLKTLKYLKCKEWVLIAFGVLFIVLQVWIDLLLPDYMKKMSELVQSAGTNQQAIIRQGSNMLLCAIASLFFAIITSFIICRIAATYSQRLRGMMFRKVDSFSMMEINQFSIGSLITRSTSDVSLVQMIVVLGLQVIIKAPILAFWAIIKISTKEISWTRSTAIIIIIMMVLIVIILALAYPKFKKIQTLVDNLTNVSRENLTGVRVIRAYNAEDFAQKKFDDVNNKLTSVSLSSKIILSTMSPIISMLLNCLVLIIYWIGATLIDRAAVEMRLDIFTDMIVFTSYAMQVVMAFLLLVVIFVNLPHAIISGRRINEVLETTVNIQNGPKTEGIPGMHGRIIFENVHFKYPVAQDYILKNISFTIQPGQTVAFIGSTGSGKTTLINLIPRFFDATDGKIFIDGIDIKQYDLHALYSKIGYVSQKAILFKGSIKDNINFGYGNFDISDEDVTSAIKIAQAEEFVEQMPESQSSIIAQNGTNLSGGQRQRLSIARAICRRPDILIFDDSFSALDYRTDRNLRTALKRETAGVTTIIIAQRIGTIMDADQIFVLDEGEIVGVGTHRQLIKSCKVYQEIAYSQLMSLAILAIILAAGLDIYAPELLRKITNEIVIGLDGSTIELSRIVFFTITLLVCYVVSTLLTFFNSLVMGIVAQLIGKKIRSLIMRKINLMPLNYFDNNSVGDVLSRINNDVDSLTSKISDGLSGLIISLIIIIGSVIMMLITNWQMMLASLGANIVGIFILILIVRYSQKYFIRAQEDIGQINGYIEEIYSGHNVVKAYNASGKTIKNFDNINQQMFTNQWRAHFFSGLLMPLMGFVGTLGYIAVCITGALLVDANASILFGVIVAFIAYNRLFNQSLQQVAQSIGTFQSASAAGKRIYEFLNEEEISDEENKTALLTNITGAVEFENVSFSYIPERKVIKNFTIKINAGMKVAIVGPTGAGKTTIVNLLMRFYEVDEGNIKIDGISIYDTKRENLRNQFCMVLQDTWLIEGTIMDNVVYNMVGVTNEQIVAACKKVGLHHFIMTLPKGYDSVLDNDNNLSEGQRQLLTIARAIVKNAPLLIFDEATSSIDTRTEAYIQNALDELMKGRTSFIIAHRLSTIRNADLILVMNDGDIIESGTHEQLLAADTFYSALYKSQFEKE